MTFNNKHKPKIDNRPAQYKYGYSRAWKCNGDVAFGYREEPRGKKEEKK